MGGTLHCPHCGRQYDDGPPRSECVDCPGVALTRKGDAGAGEAVASAQGYARHHTVRSLWMGAGAVAGIAWSLVIMKLTNHADLVSPAMLAILGIGAGWSLGAVTWERRVGSWARRTLRSRITVGFVGALCLVLILVWSGALVASIEDPAERAARQERPAWYAHLKEGAGQLVTCGDAMSGETFDRRVGVRWRRDGVVALVEDRFEVEARACVSSTARQWRLPPLGRYDQVTCEFRILKTPGGITVDAPTIGGDPGCRWWPPKS